MRQVDRRIAGVRRGCARGLEGTLRRADRDESHILAIVGAAVRALIGRYRKWTYLLA